MIVITVFDSRKLQVALYRLSARLRLLMALQTVLVIEQILRDAAEYGAFRLGHSGQFCNEGAG